MKILSTLLILFVVIFILEISNVSQELAGKYQSMNQFNNSEVDNQLLKKVDYFDILNTFIIGLGGVATLFIWKPKQKKTNES